MSSGVEFEEDKIKYGAPRASGGTQFSGYKPGFGARQPKMTQWLMDHGFAGSPAVANVILIVLVVLNIAVTYAVIRYFL